MITSTANKQVKFVSAVLKRAKTRTQEDLFAAEGLRLCAELPADRIFCLYVSESMSRNPAVRGLMERSPKTEIVSDPVFEAMADTKAPQGVLALARQRHCRFEEVAGTAAGTGRPALMLILESLQDPGNLGTIFRAAEGAGVTGILMDTGTVDIYNPKVVRSTMGSIFRMPFVYTADLPGALGALARQGVCLAAACTDGARNYDTADLCGDVGFLIGNEAAGLSGQTLSAASLRIRIPMKGRVESLNAAVAASVLVFEAARQRRVRGRHFL